MPDLAELRRFFSQTANLMVGIPDYDTYADHRRRMHPDEPVMTREEFFRNRQDNYYNKRTGRCC